MPGTDCGEVRTRAQSAATELYQIAALMMGNDSEAAEVVEVAVARAEIDPCASTEDSLEAARLRLVETAISRLSEAEPQAFAAPALPAGSGGCIEDEDVSAGELAAIIKDGPGRPALRGWLNQLSVLQRVIFVQRAILGWDNTAVAKLLAKVGPGDWQSRLVGEVFRGALCSLATSLVSSSR